MHDPGTVKERKEQSLEDTLSLHFKERRKWKGGGLYGYSGFSTVF